MTNIAALLSGGVDSCVAVHLLCEQGYKPDLWYIKIGMDDASQGYSCPQEEDLEIVQAMAHKYGLRYEVLDLQQEYWDEVVAYTIDKVKHGFTPNPDVMCNRLIKFGAFHKKVGYQYDKTATGHYAAIRIGHLDEEWRFVPMAVEDPFAIAPVDESLFLGTAPDPVKDQTDFLAQLQSFQVQHSLFPVGHMAKGEVRVIAERAKLPSAHRKDSQGICFLGKIDYNSFIERFLGVKEGPIIEVETGKVLGTHRGFWFHTIGQRKGLYLSGGPWFVVRKDIEQNIVYVSKGYNPQSQKRDNLLMHDMNWITLNPFSLLSGDKPVRVLFKIRHVADLRKGTLSTRTDGSCFLQMDEPTDGVAPGQFCCIYTPDGTICLGSGEIAWQ